MPKQAGQTQPQPPTQGPTEPKPSTSGPQNPPEREQQPQDPEEVLQGQALQPNKDCRQKQPVQNKQTGSVQQQPQPKQPIATRPGTATRANPPSV